MKVVDEYVNELEENVKAYKPKVDAHDVGWVEQVMDGVVTLRGLNEVSYGEIIEFENGQEAYIIDLTEEAVGGIVLGDYLGIRSGDQAKATGRVLSIPVSDDVLGRVLNPLGTPLDGGSTLPKDNYYPIERIAPGVVYRKSVSVPLQTGIKAIDALIPIGRGQRELIIGDRGTGKSTIALDTILNQKGEGVIAVYCAIGLKSSDVAATVELLRKKGALDYTVIVAATASEPASFQYLAPYSACAIAEYFMDQGKDVVIVYDDLTKHAWAYRQVSLILRRPAGREAYPGDVFYLHSRLLERACRRDEKFGGGSITALPIIQTLENDVSAYIPTNVISITDGQIFLETELFNAGVRPALNLGISVSRVGSSAQTKAMKSVAGKLKLDLAQYRDMAAFAQFEGDLDPETRKFLGRGARLNQILKQGKHDTYSLGEQVAIIWAASQGSLDTIEVADVPKFEERFIKDLRKRGKSLTEKITKEKILAPEDEKQLANYVKDNLEA